MSSLIGAFSVSPPADSEQQDWHAGRDRSSRAWRGLHPQGSCYACTRCRIATKPKPPAPPDGASTTPPVAWPTPLPSGSRSTRAAYAGSLLPTEAGSNPPPSSRTSRTTSPAGRTVSGRPGSPPRAWPRWPVLPGLCAAGRAPPRGAAAGRCRSSSPEPGWHASRPAFPTPPAPQRAGPFPAARDAAHRQSACLGQALPGELSRRAQCLRRPAAVRRFRSAACSWVMIPASPCASVSWISPAMRCRSSSTPASRACVSSWWCRPLFSARAPLACRWPPLSSLESPLAQLGPGW